MFDVLIYMGQSALCLAVLYVIYKVAMSQETLHRLNRVVLLGIVALSALLPLCEIKITEEVEAEWVQANNFYLPDSEVASAVEPAIAEVEPFDYVGLLQDVAVAIFFAGVAFMIVRLLLSTISVWRMIRSGKMQYVESDVTLTVVDNLPSPFSYFDHIVVAESDLAENRELILAHEMAHIRLRHSYDVLFVDLALVVWWFNPVLWLLRRELQSLHEYQADEAVLNQGVDAKTYQLLLIKRAVGARLHSIANCLNHSNLKNRITMMCKNSSSKWAAAKLLLVLPVVAFSLVATAKTVYVTVDNIDESKVTKNSENNQTKSAIEERIFDTEVPTVDNYKLSPVQNEHYKLVPAEANATTQQNEKREIKGKVVDEQGKPVGGVVVLIKNKPFGAFTDSEGNFKGLNVTNEDYLEISHVGYERKEVAVKGKSSFTITLKTKIYTTETAAEVSSEPTVLKAEEMPKFEGGDLNKFRNWVQMYIKYPRVAQEQVIQGRVIAEFVVEKDGKVSFSKIMESPHESLSAEVEGAIRHSPNWTPGTNGGKPVRVKMQIPVNFAIRNGGIKSVAEQSANKRSISGIVVDEKGNPLADALIRVRYYNRGTKTDQNGKFSGLTVDDNDCLDISYNDYLPQEVVVKGKSSFTIKMNPRVYASAKDSDASKNIATIRVTAIDGYYYNGKKVSLDEFYKLLENYDCETINVQCERGASLTSIQSELTRIVRNVNLEFVDNFVKIYDENQLRSSILSSIRNVFRFHVKNEELALGVVYADINVMRIGNINIEKI